MSSSKPLSYASLKAVIESMDPNIRVLLSVKLPAIGHAEKATPMRLDELQISEHDISLKKHSYSHRMNVVRYIKGTHALKSFNIYGRPYTTDYDVDEYGIQVIPILSTPGDLDFGNTANRLRTEEELRRIVALDESPLDSIDLKDFEMKKGNVESPYSHFIHFSNFYEGADNIIEKVEYNRNFTIALKYLIQKFLGGRQKGDPIKVKNLRLSSRSKYLRLPIGLDLDVQHLFVRFNRNGISIIRPVLAPHWSSLKSITIDRLDNQDREILSSIATVGMYACPHWSRELPYRRMMFPLSIYQNQDYILIAKNLKVTQPMVGSHYTFRIWDTTAEKLMELMAADGEFENGPLRANKVAQYQDSFILPINNRLEVLIYFNFDPIRNCRSYRFALEMEVQPRVENHRN